MVDNKPTVLALDFDGVLCDGLKEYFLTAWRAYRSLWQPLDPVPPAGLAESFYRLRPVVETGWEMPLVLRARIQDIDEAAILQDWRAIAEQLLQQERITAAQLMVDWTRDEWIATDLESWLAEHQFYPGVCDRLDAMLRSDLQVAIISTKEGRFIHQLLSQQGIDMTEIQLYGKEVKRSKGDILQELIEIYEDARFWFVEDRVQTLQGIQKRPELAGVELFLADWGYNTDRDRAQAATDPGMHLISLSHFTSNFSTWLT